MTLILGQGFIIFIKKCTSCVPFIGCVKKDLFYCQHTQDIVIHIRRSATRQTIIKDIVLIILIRERENIRQTHLNGEPP